MAEMLNLVGHSGDGSNGEKHVNAGEAKVFTPYTTRQQLTMATFLLFLSGIYYDPSNGLYLPFCS